MRTRIRLDFAYSQGDCLTMLYTFMIRGKGMRPSLLDINIHVSGGNVTSIYWTREILLI